MDPMLPNRPNDDDEGCVCLGSMTTTASTTTGSTTMAFFPNFFYSLLFLCFSYDNFFNHLNDHNYDHDDYTHQHQQHFKQVETTPKAIQCVEMAMAVAARDATRL